MGECAESECLVVMLKATWEQSSVRNLGGGRGQAVSEMTSILPVSLLHSILNNEVPAAVR